MIKKNHIYGILTLLLANPAYATLDCKQQPTCESLGYSLTDTTDCPANGYIYCPFDPSYKKCVLISTDTGNNEKSCAELGFTQDDKSEWCKNIVTCATDSAYTLCKNTDCTILGYPFSSCPANANCESCVESGGSSTKYRLVGCQSGYMRIGDICKKEITCSNSGYCTSDQTDSTTSCSATDIYLLGGGKQTCYNCTTHSCSTTEVCEEECSVVGQECISYENDFTSCYDITECAEVCHEEIISCVDYNPCS